MIYPKTACYWLIAMTVLMLGNTVFSHSAEHAFFPVITWAAGVSTVALMYGNIRMPWWYHSIAFTIGTIVAMVTCVITPALFVIASVIIGFGMLVGACLNLSMVIGCEVENAIAD